MYALDATTIDLCLSMFPWAPFRSTKAAVKLHTLLDLRGSIPTFIHISDGKMHDVNVLDLLLIEAAPSTSWIGVTWTSSGSMRSIRWEASSSRAPSKTSMHGACIRRRWIATRDSSATAATAARTWTRQHVGFVDRGFWRLGFFWARWHGEQLARVRDVCGSVGIAE